MLLTYVPKRVHFGTASFLMRMNLAVLDWVSIYSILHILCIYMYMYMIECIKLHVCGVKVNVQPVHQFLTAQHVLADYALVS